MPAFNRSLIRFFGAASVVILADYILVLTDCIVAGRLLGECALGALNLLMPVFSAVTFFGWLLASGTSAVIAGLDRRGECEKSVCVAGQGLLLSLILGVFLLLAANALEGPYLAFMSPDATITSYSGDYWRWYRAIIVLQPVQLMALYVAYVRGFERACLCSYAFTIGLNAILSYGLCRQMGMAGISLGTAIACLAGTLMLLASSVRVSGLQIGFCGGPRWVIPALRMSFGDAFVWLFNAGLFLAIIKYVLFFWDSESLAICAVVFCIIRLTTFFAGVGVALQPLKGDELSRVSHVGTTAAFALMGVAATIFFLAPELMIGLFGIETGDLVIGAKQAARITVLGLLAGGLVAVIPFFRRVKKSSFPEASVNYLQSYVLSRMSEGGDSQMFNLAKLFRLKKGIDLERLSRALVTSGAAHVAIRSVLRQTPDGGVVQRLELDAAAVTCPVVKADERELLANRASLVKSFKVFGGRLFDARIFDCGEHAYLLSNFHHLICDGYSFPLILEDAHRAWNGETLEPDAYYEVLARREERAALPLAVTGRNFMREVLKNRTFMTLPRADFCGASGFGSLELPLALPADFGDFLSAHRVTRHHVFLAATVMALKAITGADDLLIDWVFHGRVSKDELKTVGAFMVDLPLFLEGTDEMTVSDILANVKRATFNGIKGVNLYRDVADCNPTGQDRLTFIYQDEWGELMSPGPVRPDGPYAWMIEETIPLAAPQAATENPFNVEIMEHRDATRLFVEYDTGRYSEATVRRYADLFAESLKRILNA